jgi:signal transduction histidine kinase
LGLSLNGNNKSLVDLTETVRFGIAGVWPMSLVAVWLEHDHLPARRRSLGRWLFRFSIATAILLFLAKFASLWIVPRLHPDSILKNVLQSEIVNEGAAYNGLLVTAVGAWTLTRGQLHGWFQKLSVSAIFTGLSISTTSIILHDYVSLPPSIDSVVMVFKHQGFTLTVIGSLFYFARFRAADLFIKRTLRLLVGMALALTAAYLAVGPVQTIANNTHAPQAFAIVGLTALVGLVLWLVQRLSRATDAFVEHRVFGKPDYRQAAKELRERLALLESVTTVFAVTEGFVARILEIQSVRVRPSIVPSAPGRVSESMALSFEGPSSKADDTVEVPIIVGNQTEYVLGLTTHNVQHMLLTVDVEFLREVAVIVGWRLEALAQEKDRLERASREVQLVHQVVSAELRALRAQVNPHFLFNALNTIAALIPPEPEKAELMMVQLAKVFRHVLTHSDKSFSSLQEEVEFLHTYLEIEKVRFGQRLRIEFDISETAADATVPSLILQPLVENALKHGLAPKVGDNELIIRADRIGSFLCLSVEDNGVGIRESKPALSESSTGVGLRNVRERLRTIYGQRASLVLEDISDGGSRARVMIPTGETV